jgi:hypothetical protein
MKPRFLLISAALVATPFLFAQDGKQEMPNPKTKQHEAFASLAGTWQNSCKMSAMPGVPGMEKAKEWTGTENLELICNGLWLKATIDSVTDGETFQGVWLLGYDPIEKLYKSIWVSSHDEPSAISTGNYDEKTKTWTFKGKSPMGEMRAVMTQKDADTLSETCYMTGADGKEVEFMTIQRKRAAGAARDASAKVSQLPAKQPASLSKEHALLAHGTGSWNCAVTCTMPGQPASEEKATETVVPICDGKWYWTEFKGTMGGQPFSGHCVYGYEDASKQYVAYWIDSCTPHFAKLTGTLDAAKNVVSYTGEGIGMDNKPQKITQVYSQKDQDNRAIEMSFKGAEGTSQMKIVYTRAKK